MKVVTYNIHKGRGLDGRIKIERIAKVLASLNADIIALQEVFSTVDGAHGQVETLASLLDMRPAFGRTRQYRGRPYGNAVLTRWPILEIRDMDLTWRRREKRGCIRVDLTTPEGPVHVYNIHMGTSYFERRYQVRQFLAPHEIHQNLKGPRLLLGDFNEWTCGLTTRMLRQTFESLNLELHTRRRRSYPGLLPLMHLDHIYFEKPLRVAKAELIRTRLAKIASDHLPLAATFQWEARLKT